MAETYVANQYTLSRQMLGAVGLAGISLIHVMDLPSKFDETPYQGVLFTALIVASLVLADRMLRPDSKVVWMMTGMVAAATMIGFVISRTVGLPGAADDIGNWSEPLAMASLFVEAVVVWVAVSRLGLLRTARADRRAISR